ncbi:Bax inhibitor-1/YccA family protein [Lysinibacter sp. HNR]|uniref:Bax inhibitor-1/YccA family protein n=1 Tax=Lysinibacter sp. HNR TaxID=3031408 RepID=UPI00243612A0|nr:Bax inhibitor-1/YccA family protein [Lysinibacter sp. HNR]WGD38002.1 Bax inhibitor-1/YccA family protein [Lysinibacter sp. HNR]
MQSNNPALSRNPVFNGNAQTLSAEELNKIYSQPSATPNRAGIDQPSTQKFEPGVGGSADPMTYEDTIAKTAGLFAVVVAFAVVGWWFASLPIVIGAAIAGLVVGLIATFKKAPSVPLYFLYAALQGVFVGGISGMFEAMWDGIVTQAVVGTFSVVAITLLLFRSGKVRTSPRMTKIVMIAMGGYLLFSLLNFGLIAFGVLPGFGMREGIWGILIGIAVVLMAAYCLVMDFEYIKNGVEAKAPRVYGWTAGFGLMVTIIWLYLEVLRLIAIFRGD